MLIIDLLVIELYSSKTLHLLHYNLCLKSRFTWIIFVMFILSIFRMLKRQGARTVHDYSEFGEVTVEVSSSFQPHCL